MWNDFASKKVKQEDIASADENYFVIAFSNRRTIGSAERDDVKYVEAISGDQGLSMIVYISGRVNAKLEALILISRNVPRSYFIRRKPDMNI